MAVIKGGRTVLPPTPCSTPLWHKVRLFFRTFLTFLGENLLHKMHKPPALPHFITEKKASIFFRSTDNFQVPLRENLSSCMSFPESAQPYRMEAIVTPSSSVSALRALIIHYLQCPARHQPLPPSRSLLLRLPRSAPAPTPFTKKSRMAQPSAIQTTRSGITPRSPLVPPSGPEPPPSQWAVVGCLPSSHGALLLLILLICSGSLLASALLLSNSNLLLQQGNVTYSAISSLQRACVSPLSKLLAHPLTQLIVKNAVEPRRPQ